MSVIFRKGSSILRLHFFIKIQDDESIVTEFIDIYVILHEKSINKLNRTIHKITSEGVYLKLTEKQIITIYGFGLFNVNKLLDINIFSTHKVTKDSFHSLYALSSFLLQTTKKYINKIERKVKANTSSNT